MSKKRGRPIEAADVPYIERALLLLRESRSFLRKAGAHHAADYVQAAIKSTEGARNHARSIRYN